MKLPAYPGYKDSGIEWVGHVPAHWAVQPLMAAVREREETNAGMIEDNLLSLSFGRIVSKDIASNDGLLPESFETYQIVMPGDIVLRLTDLQNDKRSLRSALVQQRGIITSAYLAITPYSVSSRFLNYLLRDYDTRKVFYSMGGGLRQSMKFGDLKRMPVLLPGEDEQGAIASFLDRETSKLGSLVSSQQRLIELLTEKYQAVISHAVKKGLNASASTKSSGNAWLGAIPAHWQVRSLSSVTTKITNGYVGPTRDILVEKGVRYLQSLHIKNNAIQFDVPYFVTEEWSQAHSKSILCEGDVLVVQTGDIGQAAVVPAEFAGCNCHALIVVAPLRSELDGEWLSWCLNADYGYHTLLSIQTGALHPHLNCGNVKSIAIPVPPLVEQRSIVTFIRARTAYFTALIDEAKRAIALLQERRSALISAAVTGKIDVRHIAEAEAA